jgi:hypothetical protein
MCDVAWLPAPRVVADERCDGGHSSETGAISVREYRMSAPPSDGSQRGKAKQAKADICCQAVR